MRNARDAAAVFTIAALAACTSSRSGAIPNVATPDVATQSALQFAVGSATVGQANGASTVGLNVVATFRQPNGNNATGVNTPTLTAPAGMNFGPLLGNSNVIGGETPAQLAALAKHLRVLGASALNTPLPASLTSGFGPFVGVFGYGLAADNLVSNADIAAVALTQPTNSQPCEGIGTNYVGGSATNNVGNSFSSGYGAYYGAPPVVNPPQIVPGSTLGVADLVRSAELALPIASGASFGGAPCSCPSICTTDGSLADPNFPVQYFGGPPAWPSPQGYGGFAYFVGYPLGFTDFAATPVPGTYSLSVAVPTSADYTTSTTLTKTAPLSASSLAAPLPLFPQPTLQTNPDGSGSVSVNVPSGVREAIITVVTTDCDLIDSHRGTDHYALVTHQTGPQTLFLSALLGPPSSSGAPTHTFCTIDDVAAANKVSGIVLLQTNTAVAAVGFDYPAYESSYPFNMSAAPAITNGAGQADVTTSYPYGVTTQLNLPIEN